MFRNIQTHKLPQQIHLEGHRMGSTGHQQGGASCCSSVGVPASVPVVQVQGDRPTSGKYGSYSGLKASCPMGASIFYNNSIEITSRVPTRDRSLPRVTVVRKPRGVASYHAFVVLPVWTQFTSSGSFLPYVMLPGNMVDILLFIRLPGEQS